MRTKFNNREVCHVWASRSQNQGEGNNLYFSGGTLYSYGSHFVIGHFLNDGRLLWNTDSYSSTTSKHQSYARQAVPHWIWDKAIFVSSLNDNKVRSIDRAIREQCGQDNELIKALRHQVVSEMSAIAAMKRESEKMRSAFRSAVSAQNAAIELCAMVSGKTKAKTLAYGLPLLPAELPADKAERIALCQSIAKGEMIEQAQRQFATLQRACAELETIAGNPDTVDYWRYGSLLSELNSGRVHGQTTLDQFVLAYGANSRKLNAVKAINWRIEKISAPIKELCAAKKLEQDKTALRALVRDAWLHFHNRESTTPSYSRKRSEAGYLRSKLAELRKALPAAEWAAHDALYQRLERADQWDIACNAWESMQRAVSSAQSYFPNHKRDALSHYKSALSFVERIKQSGAFVAYRGTEAAELVESCKSEIAQVKAVIGIENAESLSKWLSGESNARPIHGGTYARIKGDIVETTMGATVPIEHACRLARIARRVIAAGGRQWLNDDGPMVGHYRVRSIGADGATVIGCHEFNAAEGMRLLSVLESCEACAEQTVGA